MLRLIGALLLLVGAASIGFGAAAQLKARVVSLRALVGALEQMERELSFRLTPMPELLSRLSYETQSPACLLFARCRDGMRELGEITMGEIWNKALCASPELLLQPREKQILSGLGQVLGQYDGDGQRDALQNAAADLRQCRERAEGEQERLGRVYGVLGMGAGAVLAILLL